MVKTWLAFCAENAMDSTEPLYKDMYTHISGPWVNRIEIHWLCLIDHSLQEVERSIKSQIGIFKGNILHAAFSQSFPYPFMLSMFGELFLLGRSSPSIHLHPRSNNSVSNRAGISDIDEGDVESEEREEYPEHVEEDEVYPEEHEVASVEILVHREPLGSESHEAYSNHR